MLERESLNTLRAAALRRISHAMPVALIALVTMTALIAAHRVPAAEVQRIVVDLVSACAAFGVANTLQAATLGGRRSTFFSRHWRITASSAAGSSTRAPPNGIGGSAVIAASSAVTERPSNGACPVKSSYKMTPRDQMSVL